MMVRISVIRCFTVVTTITIITYIIFLRWLLSASSSYGTDYKIFSSPISQNEQLSLYSSVFTHTRMHDELVELQRHLRISPAELRQPITKREYFNEILTYDETSFRQSSAPIIWLDEEGDVRWNKAAENGMFKYLTQKQFPNLEQMGNSSLTKKQILEICRPRSLFVLKQHTSGFFSRVLCFVAQFGQTLYGPRIAVLRGTRFLNGRGEQDDYLGEGIKRYFLPFSICSAYESHPEMHDLRNIIQTDSIAVQVFLSSELQKYGNDKSDQTVLSADFWKLDYHHVPIRKWLFDRKRTPVTYDSPITILTDHSNEHIYAPKNEQNFPIGDWINTNKPDAFPTMLLPERRKHILTWKDHVFGSFLRYMFALYFGSRNAPRIELGTRILAQYWTRYLIDKYYSYTYTNVFDKLAGIYIRRGDKAKEDSFWAGQRRWRNISYYVKGIIDEEQRRNKSFNYIFVMTDDASVMDSIQDYADPKSRGTDEPYARKHLRGKDILYNILAPQRCFNPFDRIGFDQFLVSMRFLLEYSSFTVGHTDSNVFRFFREILYAQRQHNPGVQSYTYIGNAPNSFEEKTDKRPTTKRL